MSDEFNQEFGFSRDLFVTRKASGDSIVVGGVSADTSRWVRILSHRAAQLLWFQMTQVLHPDKADQATMTVMTAPMRDANRPTITTHTEVEPLEQDLGGYSITGWAGDKKWDVSLSDTELQRFWNQLSEALYPNKFKQ